MHAQAPLRWVAIAFAINAVSAGLAQADTLASYRVSKVVPIGAPDRWDYITFDAGSGRVYVAHGDRVTVVDGRNGTVIGQVDGFPGGTHGVAIVPSVGRGYADDGKAGSASSFDLATLKRVRTTKTGQGADAIEFDPSSRHVFVINGDDSSVTVIDPTTDAPIASIKVGGDLEAGAVDGKGKVFINGAEKREIVRVDAASNRVDARWAIPSCESPHGIAADPSTSRIFVSCVNRILLVVDTSSGAIVATLPIGARTDAAAFDTQRKRVFSSNGDGTLTVISQNGPDDYVVQGTVPTALGARTMAVDSSTGRLYLVTADYAVNQQADAADTRHRYLVKPGSARLIFMDPVTQGANQ